MECAQQIAKFEDKLRILNDTEELWHLELGSTIAYFYEECHEWNLAMQQACAFKNVSPDSESSKCALRIAQEMAG